MQYMYITPNSTSIPSLTTTFFYHKTSLIFYVDSTALLIGEKCAVLVAEDLGYSGAALDMKVPNYHAPGELSGVATARL